MTNFDKSSLYSVVGWSMQLNNFQGIYIIFCYSSYQSYLYLFRAPRREFFKESNSFTPIFVSPHPSLVRECFLDCIKGLGKSVVCYFILRELPADKA